MNLTKTLFIICGVEGLILTCGLIGFHSIQMMNLVAVVDGKEYVVYKDKVQNIMN